MTTKEKRMEAVRLMKSRARKNAYTNGGDRKYFFGKPDNVPGNTSQKGFSDCSSAVRAAIRAAAGVDIGSNTDAQVRNRARGVVVDTTDGYYPDESKLLPGDCLYFKGNTAHVLNVGHVEMYTGDNECYGHGSGTGPNRHNLKDYCKGRASAKKRYFMAIRWILDSGTPDDPRTLKRGMVGVDVAKLQGDLITLGYDVGKWGADGEFGAATEAAVKAYQTAKGLEADGIAGEKTLSAIAADLDALGDADDPSEPAQPDGNLAVRDGSWNVRTGPGTAYPIAKTVHGGDRLAEVNADGWTPVRIDGEVKWLSEKAIEEANHV